MSSRNLSLRTRLRLISRAAVFLLAALSGACAELVVPPLELESDSRPQAGSDASAAFQLSGRIAVAHNGESFSGSLRWRHDEGGDEIFILSPMGQGIARITHNSAGASLETAEGQGYRADDVESLTDEVLGWRLPVDGLQYWIVGQSAPDRWVESQQDDDQRHIATLRQDGWRIDYQGYRSVQGTQLPAKMEMTMGDRLRVRLVIDNWVLP